MEGTGRRNSSRLFVAVAMFLGFAGFATAYDFYVGGREGWVEKTRDEYLQWAQRNRFQVGDRLIFRYKRGEDSVLQVTQTAYDTCDTTNPLRKMESGESVFRFTAWGPFFFISGAPGHCQNSQKLEVIVLSPFRSIQPLAPSPALASNAPSPTPAPVSAPAPGPSA